MSNPQTIQLEATPQAGAIGILPQIAYGTGQIAGQIFRDVPSLLLLFFMTNALGIAPVLAGIAIFVPKLVWGILCDVTVGIVSDRYKTKLARRYWLLFGAIAAPIAMVLLFHVPALSPSAKALYISGVFSLYMMAFSVFSVPYLAIAGDLSSNPGQRTLLMAWRLVFTAIGVLIADSAAPTYLQHLGGGQPAFQAVSHILAVICPLALVIAFFGTGRATLAANYTARAALSAGFPIHEALAALRAPKFSILLGANLLLLIGSGMGYASMLYFLTYNLHRSDAFVQIGLFTLIACAAIIAAQPAWVFISKHLGKKPTYIASAAFYGLYLLLWTITPHTGIGAIYGLAVILGLSNSGWTVMGFSLVSDLFEDGRAGLYASVWIAADKIGFALGGTLITGTILSAFGFNATNAMLGLPQPASAATGILATFSLAPAALSLTAAAIFHLWGKSSD